MIEFAASTKFPGFNSADQSRASMSRSRWRTFLRVCVTESWSSLVWTDQLRQEACSKQPHNQKFLQNLLMVFHFGHPWCHGDEKRFIICTYQLLHLPSFKFKTLPRLVQRRPGALGCFRISFGFTRPFPMAWLGLCPQTTHQGFVVAFTTARLTDLFLFHLHFN